jgi:MFS family permease
MRYHLLTFLCAATVIAYLQRSAIGVPSKIIGKELSIGPEEMGQVWLAWYLGYALFQLPAGWLADRIGSKAALIGFAVWWSLMTALTGAATGFTGLLVLWGVMGVAQAGIFVCAAKAIGYTFERTEQAFASGALACCMAGGAALSQWLTGQLLGDFTWQEILVVYAVPGVVWAVAFALLVPRPDPPAASTPKPSGEPVQWSRLLTDRHMILLCAQQFQRAAAAALFFTWFPRFLQETKGLTEEEAGAYAAWPLLAGMVGGLVGGTLSDWVLRRTGNTRLSRQGLAFLLTSLCAGVSLAAYYAETAVGVVLLVSIVGLLMYAAGVNGYATAMAMGGKRVAPVFATMNMCGNIGAGVFPFAVGQLVGHTGNWNLTLLLFAGLFGGSALCWLGLNPKGTLFDEEPASGAA